MVKTLHSNARSEDLIPDRGTGDLKLKNQNMKEKQYCYNFNKNFKNGPHPPQKRNLKKSFILHLKKNPGIASKSELLRRQQQKELGLSPNFATLTGPIF